MLYDHLKNKRPINNLCLRCRYQRINNHHITPPKHPCCLLHLWQPTDIIIIKSDNSFDVTDVRLLSIHIFHSLTLLSVAIIVPANGYIKKLLPKIFRDMKNLKPFFKWTWTFIRYAFLFQTCRKKSSDKFHQEFDITTDFYTERA